MEGIQAERIALKRREMKAMARGEKEKRRKQPSLHYMHNVMKLMKLIFLDQIGHVVRI